MRVYWTEEEEKHLIYQYIELGLCLSELYENHISKYPFRTKTALQIKLKKLKVHHTKNQISELKSRLNSGEKNGMFGKESPNKGLTKENSDRIRISSEKISQTRKRLYTEGKLNDISGINNPMYGKDSWNKGKTKYTDDRLRISGEKMSIYQKNRWNDLSDVDKNKIIGKLTLAANKARKDTKIEVIIKNVLEKMGVNFIKNFRYSRFVFDFYLTDYNFIIECQGDYWHGNSEFFKNLNDVQNKNIKRDIIKKAYIEENKMGSLFLWENEIYRNIDNLEEIIWQQLR